jgi:hypothetical protein
MPRPPSPPWVRGRRRALPGRARAPLSRSGPLHYLMYHYDALCFCLLVTSSPLLGTAGLERCPLLPILGLPRGLCQRSCAVKQTVNTKGKGKVQTGWQAHVLQLPLANGAAWPKLAAGKACTRAARGLVENDLVQPDSFFELQRGWKLDFRQSRAALRSAGPHATAALQHPGLL